MRTTELIRALRRLSIETGRVACPGCKYEYRCGIHGCAIICEAATRLEELRERAQGPRWISVNDRLPGPWEDVLVRHRGNATTRPRANILFRSKGRTDFGCDDVFGPVTHWMPLPELPGEVK